MASEELDSNRNIGAVFGIAIVLGSAILGAVAKVSSRTIGFEGDTSFVNDVLPGNGAVEGAMIGLFVLTAIVTTRKVNPIFKSGFNKVELCDVERGAIIGAMAGLAIPVIMFGRKEHDSAFDFALTCLVVPPGVVLISIAAGAFCLFPIEVAGAIVDGDRERLKEARSGAALIGGFVGFFTFLWLVGHESKGWLIGTGMIASFFGSVFLGDFLCSALGRIRRAHGLTMALLLVTALAALAGGVGMVVRFTRQPSVNAGPDREAASSVDDEDQWHPPMRDWEAEDFDPFKLLLPNNAQDREED